MPVVEVHSSQELYEKIGDEGRKLLFKYWREAVRTALDIHFSDVGARWHPWSDADNMEDIEILVHFSPGSTKYEVEVAVKLIHQQFKIALTLTKAVTAILGDVEIGVWPQPHHDAVYEAFRTLG